MGKVLEASMGLKLRRVFVHVMMKNIISSGREEWRWGRRAFM